MKKTILFTLPVLTLLVVGAKAYNAERHPVGHALEEVISGARGYRIGVVLSEISPHLRDDLKIEGGILVEEVLENSPAEKAGLRDGDILLKINGKTIVEEDDLRKTLRDMEDATELKLDVIRDGKPLTISVLPEKHSFKMLSHFSGVYVGVQLQEMNSDLAKYFQVEPNRGVLVTEVVEDSPAEKGGLKAGDVVVQINGKQVTDPQDLREKLNDAKEGESVSFTVVRHGKQQNLTVQPEARRFGEFGHLKNLPKIAELPEMSELSKLRELRDSPEMRRSMRELERELGKLKNEIETLKRHDFNKLESEIREKMKDFEKQMQDLRKSD